MNQESVKAMLPTKQDRYQQRLPIEHEESGDRKQCHEHGGVPVNTFNSILKRRRTYTPQILFAGGPELPGSAQCHDSCLTAERSVQPI